MSSMPYGLSAEEIDWVAEGYRLFRVGDPAFMDRYTDDAKFTFPSTLPAGGTYDGPFEALAFWTAIGERFEDPHPEPEEFLRVEDRLIVLGTLRACSRETGERVAVRFVHAMRVDGAGDNLTDQKVVSFEVLMDTAAVLNALGPSGSD